MSAVSCLCAVVSASFGKVIRRPARVGLVLLAAAGMALPALPAAASPASGRLAGTIRPAASGTVLGAAKRSLKAHTPTVVGMKVQTLTLHAAVRAWGPGKVKLTYRWLRNGRPIAGATHKHYMLRWADVGKRIQVKVTGKKAGYKTVSKKSKKTNVVQPESAVFGSQAFASGTTSGQSAPGGLGPVAPNPPVPAPSPAATIPACVGVQVTGSLAASTTWDPSHGCYSVSGTLTIPAGVTLTIDPGTTVRMAAGASIEVYGSLDVDGTESSRVTITSWRDAGTPASGVTSSPAPSTGTDSWTELLSALKALPASNYTPASWAPLASALAEAQAGQSASAATDLAQAELGLRTQHGPAPFSRDGSFSCVSSGTANSAAAGDWAGLDVAGGQVNARYLNLGYASTGFGVTGQAALTLANSCLAYAAGTAIDVDDTGGGGDTIPVSVTNTTFTAISNHAIATSFNQPVVTGDSFADIGGSAAIDIEYGGGPTIDNNRFNNVNGAAVYIHSGDQCGSADPSQLDGATVTDNTFTNVDPHSVPVAYDPVEGVIDMDETCVKLGSLTGNQLVGGSAESGDALLLNDVDLVASGTLSDAGGLVPLIRNGLGARDGVTLTIAAGAVIKMEDGAAIDAPTITVQGTSGDPSVITSWRDDTVGGDTDRAITSSGAQVAPAPGDWGSRYESISGKVASTANGLIIRYGTGGDWQDNVAATYQAMA